MKVLVAGATGAVGRRLVPLLAADGHEAWGTSRDDSRAATVAGLGAQPIVLDVLDRDLTFAVLQSVQPDLVIHQLTDLGRRDFGANARLRHEGTPNLVDAMIAAGVGRLIVQSVAFAYAPGTGPAREADPLDVTADGSHGNLARAIAALEAAAARIPGAVVLRYGLLYGPGTWFATDGHSAEQARRGELVADDAVVSFTHVDDAAGIARAAIGWPGGIVNAVDDHPAAGHDWVPAFAVAVGAPPPPERAGGAAFDRGASNERARTRPGWHLRYPSWREGFVSAL